MGSSSITAVRPSSAASLTSPLTRAVPAARLNVAVSRRQGFHELTVAQVRLQASYRYLSKTVAARFAANTRLEIELKGNIPFGALKVKIRPHVRISRTEVTVEYRQRAIAGDRELKVLSFIMLFSQGAAQSFEAPSAVDLDDKTRFTFAY